MHGQKTTGKKFTTTLELYLGESPVPLIELYFVYTEKTISQIKIAASFSMAKRLHAHCMPNTPIAKPREKTSMHTISECSHRKQGIKFEEKPSVLKKIEI